MSQNIENGIKAKIIERLTNPSDFLDYDGVLQLLVVGGQNASWVVDFTELEPHIYEGVADTTDCTITLADEDVLALSSGELTPHQAFQGGKLKIEGDNRIASAALKLLT